MKQLYKYIKKYKIYVILPFLLMLINIVLDMFNPYLVKVIIDDVLKGHKYSILNMVLLGLLGITIFRAIFGYFKEFLCDVLSYKVAQALKQDLFDHIQKLPFSYFDNMNTGELMSRIGEDVDNVWRAISFGIRLFIENIMYFTMATAILFYLDYKLTLFCLITMPPVGYLAIKLEKKFSKSFEELSDQAAVLNTTAQENIAGVRLVKAFAREKHEILKFLQLNKKNYDLNVAQSGIIAKYFPKIEFFTNFPIVFMVTLGGMLVVNKSMSIGTLVAFNGYIWSLIWPLRMIGWLTNMISQNNASCKKIFSILDIEPAIKDSECVVHKDSIEGYVEFQNVSFKYNEEYVLKNVSFKAKKNSVTAIMGATGSGKSSIVNLIGRYYDANEGRILVDNVDVKNLELKTLRSSVSNVSQDVFLFSDTILNNISFGRTDATLDEVKEATALSCAKDFVEELEEGYETLIGERGLGLSGGQKQRLSIARALISKAPILILDDASSALDMETEYRLLKNLNESLTSRTTFIIAHRISAVKNADLILFLENGEIVEQGTHEELLCKKGQYYNVYAEQFKDFENLEGEVV